MTNTVSLTSALLTLLNRILLRRSSLSKFRIAGAVEGITVVIYTLNNNYYIII